MEANSCFSNILYVSGFLKLNRGQNYVMVGNQTMVSSVGGDNSTTELPRQTIARALALAKFSRFQDI